MRARLKKRCGPRVWAPTRRCHAGAVSVLRARRARVEGSCRRTSPGLERLKTGRTSWSVGAAPPEMCVRAKTEMFENEHRNNETQKTVRFARCAQLVDARRGRHGHGPRRGLPRRRRRAPRGGEDSHRRRGVHAFHEHGASGRRARRHRGVPRGPRQRDLRRRPARHAERRGRPVPPRARGERARHGHRYAGVRTPAVAPAPAPAPRARDPPPPRSRHIARWAPACVDARATTDVSPVAQARTRSSARRC